MQVHIDQVIIIVVQHLSEDQVLHMHGILQTMLIYGDEQVQDNQINSDHVQHDIMYQLQQNGKLSMMHSI